DRGDLARVLTAARGVHRQAALLGERGGLGVEAPAEHHGVVDLDQGLGLRHRIAAGGGLLAGLYRGPCLVQEPDRLGVGQQVLHVCHRRPLLARHGMAPIVPEPGRHPQHPGQLLDIRHTRAMSPSQTSNAAPSRARVAGRYVVDDTDLAIIEALQEDGRMSVRSLAARVHISRAAAYARLQRLEEEGVITGYTVQVVPERIGLGTSAYVSVSIEQNTW